MARKRKKAKHVKLAGLRVPTSLALAAIAAANTPLGRIILAEALVHAASLLIRKPPVAAATAAEEAASSAKDMAGSAAEAAAKFMHAVADRLRASAGLGDGGSTHKPDQPRKSRGAGRNGRNRSSDVWDHIDQDTIRQALLGELSGKKGKKAKSAKRA